jgi:kumamolisin
MKKALIVVEYVALQEGAQQAIEQPVAKERMKQSFILAKHLRRGFPLQVFFGLCALVFVLAGCSGQQSNSQPTSQTPISLPSLGDLGKLPVGATGALPQGAVAPNTTIQLTIGLTTNEQKLDSDLASLYDPNSSAYGQFYKPADLASRYGASQSTIDQVTTFLKGQGFQVVSVSKLHDSIQVKASVLQIAQTFGVALQLFQKNGETFFGPTGQFALPASIKSLVSYVQGLNDYSRPQPRFARQQSARPLNPANCQGIQGVVPGQMAAAYDYNSVYKKGYTGAINVGVVEFNDAVDGNDVNTFLQCTTNGVTLKGELVQVDGGAPNADPSSGETGEATLDIEELAALAPKAYIIEYQGHFCDSNSCNDTTSFAQAMADVLNAVGQDDRTPIVSVSWGGWEGDFATDDLKAIDQQLKQLAAEGITVAIATGDCAAFETHVFNQLGIGYPASDPYALAVGGTTLQTDSQGRRSSEITWYDSQPDQSQCNNSWGSTGGVSIVWKQPSWQTGPGVKNKYSKGSRQVPDIAAVANNVFMVFQGQAQLVGGTSIAAPVWAAGIALIEQALIKNHNSVLAGVKAIYYIANKYGSKHPYFDVTRGNNLYYPATGNWDFDTGWGSPNLFNFGNSIGAFSK